MNEKGSRSTGYSSEIANPLEHSRHNKNSEMPDQIMMHSSNLLLQLPSTGASSIKYKNQKQLQQIQQRKSSWNGNTIRCMFLLVIFAIHSLGNVYNTWIMEQFLVISSVTVSKQQGSDSLSIVSSIVSVPRDAIVRPETASTNNSIYTVIQDRSSISIHQKEEDISKGKSSLSIKEYIQQEMSASDNVAAMIQNVGDPTKMIQNLEFAYTNVQEMLDRHKRFPTVEQRIKVYMSNWYTPPCDDDARISFRFSNSFTTEAHVSLKEISLQQQQDEVIENEKRNHKDQRIFRVYRATGSSRDLFDEIHYVDRELFLSVKHQYHKDIVEFFLPSLDKHLNNKTGTNNTTPILYQFGDTRQPRANLLHLENGVDAKFTQLVRNPRFPVIQKVRTSLSSVQLAAFTDQQDCYHINERRGIVSRDPFNNAYNRVRLEPIILKLKTHRHYGSIYKIAELDTVPWNEKKNMAIFRGALTGSYPDSMGKAKLEQLSIVERCRLLPRCWLSCKHASSELVDAKLTEPTVEGSDGPSKSTYPEEDKMIPRTVNLNEDSNENESNSSKVELFGGQKTKSELLEYKALILLEGNDISSGLKWALFSNSVVLMPEPTLTSWAMEEMLQPWVHYVPINLHKDNSRNGRTDVEEKMQWILDNDDKARQIVRASTLWIADLVLHPDVKKDETEIFDEVARRYLTHFVPTSGQPI
jgi:Glycosyl transferase family 90